MQNELTREQIEDYRERFYQVLGKEVADEVCDLALAALDGEDVWGVVNTSVGKVWLPDLTRTKRFAEQDCRNNGEGWHVQRFKLVRAE